ncbi:MAG: MlaD family protein [Rhodospirillum sp.]|nr:MlaD family protein [Rhodospirillum sp.]MCF8491188.1 MlaD family protein [Rhodospirillum sp.]MCF8499616.1 MlaD family protein [Rhodospirillum sp.]
MGIGRVLRGGLHGDRAETLIGAIVVLVGTALLAATSINRHDTETPEGAYQVEAVFNRADGIGVGSEVRVAGIPVGRVVNHTLDDEYRAVVTMRLDLGGEELSSDAAAKIQTDGLLGSKYIEVVTSGGGYGTIPSGERLDFTQDSVIFEDLLSKIVAMAKVKRGLDPNIPASEQDMPAPQSILDEAPTGDGGGPDADRDCSPAVNLFAPWSPGPDGGKGAQEQAAPVTGAESEREPGGETIGPSVFPSPPLTSP